MDAVYDTKVDQYNNIYRKQSTNCKVLCKLVVSVPVLFIVDRRKGEYIFKITMQGVL